MIQPILPTLIKVWLAFLILLAPFLNTIHENFLISTVQIFAVFLLVNLWQSRYFHSGNSLSRWFFRLSLVWLGLLGLSAFFSRDPSLSFPMFSRVIGLFLVTASIRYSLEEPGAENTLYLSAGLAILFYGSVGLVEYIQEKPIPLTWMDPGMKGLIKSRSAGLLGDPNLFGVHMASLLPFALAGLYRYLPNPIFFHFWGICLLVGGMGLLTSLSRGSYLACLAGISFFLLMAKPSLKMSRQKVFISYIALILIFAFFWGPFKNRFFSIVNSSDMTLSQRTLINKGLARAFPYVPYFGFGFFTFNLIYPQFRLVGGDYPFHGHNEILQSYLETGPFATILLICICLTLFRHLYLLFRKPRNQISFLTMSTATSFVIFFFQNLTGFSCRVFPTALILAIAVGGILRDMKNEQSAPDWRFLGLFPKAAALITVGIFCAITVKIYFVQYFLASAKDALDEKKFLEAERSLKAIEFMDSRIPLQHCLMASVHEHQGELAKANERIRRAISLNPSEAAYWVYQSRLARRTPGGNPFPPMEKAVQLDPASELFRLEYAQLIASSGEPLLAIRELDNALSYSPGFHDVYIHYQKVEAFRKELFEKLSLKDREDYQKSIRK